MRFYRGYGQEVAPLEQPPTREELLAATEAAEIAAQQAELQMALARQQQEFNNSLISGFVASAALAVVAWGIGQAIVTRGKK